VIVSFGDALTEDLFNGSKSARARRVPPDVRARGLLRLEAINLATVLEDLKVPPSNRLEQLAGDLAGFWSIRVNDQWRIIFKFEGGNASEVRFLDYH
jgi:toxin HigB-1